MIKLCLDTLKENGQVLHMSMYQALIQEKWEWEECKDEYSLLIELLLQRLGPAMVSDLSKLCVENPPKYDQYEDKPQNNDTFPMLDEEPEVSPRWGDQYINA